MAGFTPWWHTSWHISWGLSTHSAVQRDFWGEENAILVFFLNHQINGINSIFVSSSQRNTCYTILGKHHNSLTIRYSINIYLLNFKSQKNGKCLVLFWGPSWPSFFKLLTVS